MAEKYALGVRLFGSEHVIQDSRQLMGCCGYGFRRAEFATHAPEEFSEVVVGVIKALRTHPGRVGDPVFDWSCLRVQDLASTDLFLWTQSKPRRKCGRIPKSRNIGSDLADD